MSREATPQNRLDGIETESALLNLRTVAVKARGREDRTDVAGEVGGLRMGDRDSKPHERSDGEQA